MGWKLDQEKSDYYQLSMSGKRIIISQFYEGIGKDTYILNTVPGTFEVGVYLADLDIPGEPSSLVRQQADIIIDARQESWFSPENSPERNFYFGFGYYPGYWP
jgi:hypothetical protein